MQPERGTCNAASVSFSRVATIASRQSTASMVRNAVPTSGAAPPKSLSSVHSLPAATSQKPWLAPLKLLQMPQADIKQMSLLALRLLLVQLGDGTDGLHAGPCLRIDPRVGVH